MDCPTEKQEIKCPTNKNEFTVDLYCNKNNLAVCNFGNFSGVLNWSG